MSAYVTAVSAYLSQQHILVQAFAELVGRQYRLTNHLDVVPELPTYNDYVAVGNRTGLWATNNTILVQERPDMKVDQLTWDDHSCNLYEGNLIYTPAAILPANTATLVNATAARTRTEQSR